MDQVRLDRAANLRTGVFISGYEGSPLGGYDMALQRVRPLLDSHGIRFQPAVNEDLAATSIFGSQIHHVVGQSKVDGVVGIWYGKGPGVDRSCDVFRHANLAGSPGNCAALVLAGDDHPCKSSSIPHQSDFSLMSVGIPILFPGNTQEVLDYGLYAIALSRYSGAWVGMKLLVNICDGGGTVLIDPTRHRFVAPEGYTKLAEPRLSPPFTVKLETETNHRRLAAVNEFVRANPINRWHGASAGARLGIATTGKYYYDTMQALADLGIGPADLDRLGIRVARFGVTFPLEPRFAGEFAHGLETIIVVEEKRSFLELQLRDALYNLPDRPRILGKQDEHGAELFPAYYELDPDRIARILGPRLTDLGAGERAAARLRRLEQTSQRPRELSVVRTPNYCPGCPHNRSTRLLEGHIAGGGIGCHGMGIMMTGAERGYLFATQMGGEGAPWIGMAPFVERKHMFQNIGDGTYFHSGALAIEAAVASGVNITYKILYNGAVAMTGGQQAIGALPVPELTCKLAAEGVRRIAVVTEDIRRYPDPGKLAMNAVVRPREELNQVLREFEQEPGVTVVIYDQECAAEKRRKRSRGIYAEPVERLVIHEQVCEGCGDCIVQSNCMSLTPVTTEFGDKVQIHQSSCNKDYTCALGDCPSFVRVTVKAGTGLRKPALPELGSVEVAEPARIVSAGDGYRVLCPGIGGTGVVTISALLATAATIDGLHVITLDQTGLAQKGGAVVSHLTFSDRPIQAPVRINTANADLVLGFDLVTLTHPDNFKCLDSEKTAAVLNTTLTPTGETIRKRRVLSDLEQRLACIEAATARGRNIYADATRIAERLFGTHMLANMFLLGAAWQSGALPIRRESLESAIRLNAVDVDRNLQAFLWGRKYYVDAAAVESLVAPQETVPTSLDSIAVRVAELTQYQNAAYARRYSEVIDRAKSQAPELVDTIARNLYKLMAYKDEYEVARLLTAGSFRARIQSEWEAPAKVRYLLHPPLLRRLGLKQKLALPAWPLKILARLKFIRGTAFDIFGYTAHRRRERSLIDWYLRLIDDALASPGSPARDLLNAPDSIRGYESIKDRSIAAALQQVASIASGK
jgi:indolepyruvate ferredoxin oxidoreductase